MRFLIVVMALAACGEPADAPDAGTPPEPDAGITYPPPRDDVVPRVGSDATVDVATWNIENFPRDDRTPEHVANLITSMELDLIAVEEIADAAAFNELVARLPHHDGVLSTHTYGDGSYQKLGFIYDTDLLTVSGERLLLTQNGWESPRPPLQVNVAVNGSALDFTAIVVHQKAGRTSEDATRRSEANRLLEEHVAAQVAGAGDPDVLVIGDFNEILTSSAGRATMAPWLDTTAYVLHTDELASSHFTFIPSESVIDHAVSTTSLGPAAGSDSTVIPRLDSQFPGYENVISDHLPVVVSIPTP